MENKLNNTTISSYTYSYDNSGNITEVRDNGSLLYKYVYDEAGQVAKYYNFAKSVATTYTYDNNGNIQSKTPYTNVTSDDLSTATQGTAITVNTSSKHKFNTSGTFSVTVNGKVATVANKFSDTLVLIYYTFDYLPDVTINEIVVPGTFSAGDDLAHKLKSPDNTSIDCLWYRNGDAVKFPHTVSPGEYYARITMTAEAHYKFADNVKIYALAGECTDVHIKFIKRRVDITRA